VILLLAALLAALTTPPLRFVVLGAALLAIAGCISVARRTHRLS
jgi:hypothetical protein